MTQLSGIRACVFDAYGTLFDVHSAVAACRPLIGAQADRLSALWRQKQLEYTWLRSLMQRYTGFDAITADALDYAMAATGLQDAGLRERLLKLYLRLAAYPEAPGVLAALRDTGRATAILSNGTPEMLESAVSAAGLSGALDQILSVESCGVYKPHPSVYQLAVDRLGVTAAEICFLSANGWDAAGAAAFGFQVVWINRFGQPPERLPGQARAALPDLTGLPALLETAS